MAGEDRSRTEVLEQARARRPWTADILLQSAADPVAFKRREPTCTDCPRPCTEEEVCATAVGHSHDLFDTMGRDQVYHLLESGMKRLRARDEAVLRTADRAFPNTFVRLVNEQPATTTETTETSDTE
jgi:hypothetical protein